MYKPDLVLGKVGIKCQNKPLSSKLSLKCPTMGQFSKVIRINLKISRWVQSSKLLLSLKKFIGSFN